MEKAKRDKPLLVGFWVDPPTMAPKITDVIVNGRDWPFTVSVQGYVTLHGCPRDGQVVIHWRQRS